MADEFVVGVCDDLNRQNFVVWAHTRAEVIWVYFFMRFENFNFVQKLGQHI